MNRPVHDHIPATSLFAEWPQWRQDAGLQAHAGTDYAAPEHTPCFATLAGTVNKSESDWGGLAVEIDAGDKYCEYHHLFQQVGPFPREVRVGDLVGFTGNTGTQTTGAHLHYVHYVKRPEIATKYPETGGWLYADPAMFVDNTPPGARMFMLWPGRQPIC